MEKSHKFLSLILDSITEHIVVINDLGEIEYVNNSWLTFGDKNSCNIADDWIGVNYINECDKAAEMGDDFGKNAGDGIRSVINERESIFYLEYPCHSPDEKRWFIMRVTPLCLDQHKYFVISHQDITERKLAEEEVANLAIIDGLTGIPNRRAFNDFFREEWRRCARLKKTICLAIVDLDHFKLLNDTYGHQAGDDCLIRVGSLLKTFINRPSDICARYGGDEFVLVLGDTSLEQADNLLNSLLKQITALNIINHNSPTQNYITASIGIAEMPPNQINDENELISKADSLLYRAKKLGRNRVEA